MEQNHTPDGGSGGRSPRTDSGRTAIQDTRLEGLAIKRGWLKGQRWPTEALASELEARKAEQGGELNLKEKMLLKAHSLVESADDRIANIAARNVIAAEAQNQKDDEAEQLGELQALLDQLNGYAFSSGGGDSGGEAESDGEAAEPIL